MFENDRDHMCETHAFGSNKPACFFWQWSKQTLCHLPCSHSEQHLSCCKEIEHFKIYIWPLNIAITVESTYCIAAWKASGRQLRCENRLSGVRAFGGSVLWILLWKFISFREVSYLAICDGMEGADRYPNFIFRILLFIIHISLLFNLFIFI